jgi:hypothetical protein
MMTEGLGAKVRQHRAPIWKPRSAARSGVRQHYGVNRNIVGSPTGVTRPQKKFLRYLIDICWRWAMIRSSSRMAGLEADAMALFTARRLRDSTRRARSLAAMFILVLQLPHPAGLACPATDHYASSNAGWHLFIR